MSNSSSDDNVTRYEEGLDQEFERAYHAIPSDDQITIKEETQRYAAMTREELDNKFNTIRQAHTEDQPPLPIRPRQRELYQSIMNQLLVR